MGPVNDRVRNKWSRARRHQIRDQMEYAGGVSAVSGAARRLAAMSRRSSARPRFAKTLLALRTKQPTPEQLDEMRQLVRQEMEAGALGIGTSLIYPPAFYAKTEELIELCKVAAKYQGKYISHMRSEGNRLLEAIDELLRISARSEDSRGDLSHQSRRQPNWPKADELLARIEARAKGRTEDHARTCTPTPPPAPASTPVCRRGRRTAVIRRLFKRLRDPATRAENRKRKCGRRATNGKIFISRPARRRKFCSSDSSRKN